MSKYRFDPLALLDNASPKPAVPKPASAVPAPKPVATEAPPVTVAVQLPSPDEADGIPVNPQYAAAVSAAFAAVGYPDARAKENVFTFRQWMKRDRCVQKGQRGVRVEIMVPRGKPAKLVPRPIFLFHVSQTRSLTEPAPVMPTQIRTQEDVKAAAAALCSSRNAVLPNQVDPALAPPQLTVAAPISDLRTPISDLPSPRTVIPFPAPAVPSWKRAFLRRP